MQRLSTLTGSSILPRIAGSSSLCTKHQRLVSSHMHKVLPLFSSFKSSKCRLDVTSNIDLWAGFSYRSQSSISGSRREIVQFKLSDIGEGIGEVNVKEWYVTVGQKVNQFDSICEVQSDKASVTITSKFDGVIKKLHYDIDDMAKVGQPLVDIEIQAGDGNSENLIDEIDDQETSSRDEQEHEVSSSKKSLATPAVRRLAMENRIDLTKVHGTGRDGRVMKEDVLRFLEEKGTKSVDSSSDKMPATNTYDATNTPQLSVIRPQLNPPSGGKDQVIKMSPITRAMFKSMTQSLQIPHLGLSDDVDANRLIQMKSSLKQHSLTFLPFFLKAASICLKEFPILNSSISQVSNDEIILKSNHNIGFAMDTPSGLIVPNVKRVQELSILEISAEIKRLMEDGHNDRIKPSDLLDGTFSLSNIGSIGGTFGIPVILPPQVAIGAIGRIQVHPAFGPNDTVIKSHFFKVVWSADHRIIDGATITRFSNRWKTLLEEPEQMLFYLK